MNFFQRIQNLPENKRRIILWLITIVVGAVLIFWWGRGLQEKIKNFNLEKIEDAIKNVNQK